MEKFTRVIITDWYNTYTKYMRIWLPEAKSEEILYGWNQRTEDLISHFKNNPNIWGDNFVKCLQCYIDYYKRQIEHCEYRGINNQTKIVPSNQGRYWK